MTRLRTLPRNTFLLALSLLTGLSLPGFGKETAGTDSPNGKSDSRRIPVVAVSELDTKGVGKNEVDVIADNLASRLQQSGRFRVMERSQMADILKEQSFQKSGACDGGQCAVEMGKLLGIDRMVVGSVGLVGRTYSLNLRLVDVATGEAVRTSSRNQKGSIDDVLTSLVPEATSDLLGKDEEATTASPSGTRIWPWILGGTAVAGGGVAAILLMNGKSSSADATTTTSDNHFKITW